MKEILKRNKKVEVEVPTNVLADEKIPDDNNAALTLKEFSDGNSYGKETSEFKIGNEVYTLNTDEATFLVKTKINFEDENWINNEDYDINLRIVALFAMSKTAKAYEIINQRKADINYKVISATRFFKYDRYQTDLYKHLYDNNQIDDETYKYFNVLSGSLFDHDFWNKIFESADKLSDLMDIINSSFNGVSPFDVGLVEEDKYLSSIIDKYIEKEKNIVYNDTNNKSEYQLDDFIKHKTCVGLTPETLYKLIDSGYFQNKTFAYKCVLVNISVKPDIKDKKNEMNQLFNKISEEKTSNDIDILIDFTTIDEFKLFNEWFNEFIKNCDNEFIKNCDMDSRKRFWIVWYYRLLSNSTVTAKYANYIYEIISNSDWYRHQEDLCEDDFEFSSFIHDMIIYLESEHMEYAQRYSILHNYVGEYHIMLPNIIYNSYITVDMFSKEVKIGNSLIDVDEFLKSWSFVKDFIEDPEYDYHDKLDIENKLLEACDNECDFIEFMCSAYRLYNEVSEWFESLRYPVTPINADNNE